jgi:hypothetical protein
VYRLHSPADNSGLIVCSCNIMNATQFSVARRNCSSVFLTVMHRFGRKNVSDRLRITSIKVSAVLVSRQQCLVFTVGKYRQDVIR